MKKIAIGICATLGITLIGFGIYISLPATTPANTSHAYEYYYTKENADHTKEPSVLLPSEPPTDGNTGEASSVLRHPQTPDTEPSSITVLVNHLYTLPADYIPEDLVVPDVAFNFSFMAEKRLMRADAAGALEELFRAAEEEGIHLFAISGYRSYVRQNRIYLSNVKNSGEDYANRYSAPPGHSEHQTGLTMDVSCASNDYNLTYELADLPEGKWLKDNAHRFGFIIRYPKDKEEITGYAYEPWHVRYVGKELASYLFEQGISLDEYYGYTAIGHEWVFDFDAAYRLLAATTPPGSLSDDADETEETDSTEDSDEASDETSDETSGENSVEDSDEASPENSGKNPDKNGADAEKEDSAENGSAGETDDTGSLDKPDNGDVSDTAGSSNSDNGNGGSSNNDSNGNNSSDVNNGSNDNNDSNGNNDSNSNNSGSAEVPDSTDDESLPDDPECPPNDNTDMEVMIP